MARKKAKALPPKMFTVYGDIVQETEDAILLVCDDEAVWLPKSQIEYHGERGDDYVEIALPDWLAAEKGLSDRQGVPQPVHASPVGSPDVDAANGEDSGDSAPEPLPDDGEDDEPGASAVANDRHWMRQETITVTQELTQGEKAGYADEMARLDDEIEELETERDRTSKALKKQIDAKEDERRGLSKIVREDTETREIFCDLVADYNTCEMVWTDAHPPHEEVRRRKMTAEERQLPLTMNTRPDPADPPADGEADNGEDQPADAPSFDAHDADAPAARPARIRIAATMNPATTAATTGATTRPLLRPRKQRARA